MKVIICHSGSGGHATGLREQGEQQAERLAEMVALHAGEEEYVLRCSYHLAARQTATIVADKLLLGVTVTEVELGARDGHTHDQRAIDDLIRSHLDDAPVLILMTHQRGEDVIRAYAKRHGLEFSFTFRNGEAVVIDIDKKSMSHLAQPD